MWDGCRVIWSLLIGLFRSRATLEAENLVLRQQILVLRRTAPKRLSFNALDRLILTGYARRIRGDSRLGTVSSALKALWRRFFMTEKRLFQPAEETHGHEQKLRAESVALIHADPELSKRL